MNTETYQNKKITTAGDSNSKTGGLNDEKSNTYKRSIFIVAGSLLALLVWIAVLGKNVGQHLTPSAAEIAKGDAGAPAEYQVDTTYSELTKDIFGLDAVFEKNGGNGGCNCRLCDNDCKGFPVFCGNCLFFCDNPPTSCTISF